MAAERIWLDDWEITQGTTRQWESREGTDEWAGLAGADPVVSSRDGAVWRSRTLAPGTFQLMMWVRGTDYATARAQWENVLRVVNRRHRPITIRRALPDGEQITAKAVLTGQVRPVHVGQTMLRATLSFTLPEGRWYSTASVTASSLSGTMPSRTLTIPDLARSTAPTPALLVLTGPSTLFTVRDETDTLTPLGQRSSVTYDGPIPAGGTLTLHSQTWAMSTSAGWTASMDNLRFTGARFLEVNQPGPGGTPTLLGVVAGAGAGTRFAVTANRAYVT